MAKVSIITPAFNAASYIKDTVESVQAQTFSDWEMIIVDDCSTDDTYNIAKQLAKKDSRIITLNNATNLGVAFSRNKAIEVATGEYIAFLDSDDLWLPDKLNKQLSFMENNQIIFSFTSYQKFDSLTGTLTKVIHVPSVMKAKKILGNTIIGCLTVMYNASIVGKVKMPNLSHMEDNATWYSILSRGYLGYGIDETLALYRDGNNSLTKGKKNNAKKQWKVYREFFHFSIFKSLYYFLSYGINALRKHYF